MTNRPFSSDTTILVNLVGRLLVSAMTQTPASGPRGPLTVPPISSGLREMFSSALKAGEPAPVQYAANPSAPTPASNQTQTLFLIAVPSMFLLRARNSLRLAQFAQSREP